MKRLNAVVIVACVLSTLVLYPLATAFAKEPAPEQESLRIGLITSMTGPMAPAMKSIADAVKPAQELMNQRGGVTVKGKQYLVKIVAEDDQSSPQGGISAATKLMQAGVKFIIAPQFPPINMAVAPLLEEAKIIHIKSMGIGKEEMGPKMRYGFYGTAVILNIPVCYDYLSRKYPAVKKIALITPEDPGIKSNREATEKEIRKHGFEIVFQEMFKMGSEDFYPLLTKALQKKPDAIDMIIGVPIWAAGIVNQSRQARFYRSRIRSHVGRHSHNRCDVDAQVRSRRLSWRSRRAES